MGINWGVIGKNIQMGIKLAGAKITFTVKDDVVNDPIHGTQIKQTISRSGYGVVDNVNQNYISRVGSDNVLQGDKLLYLEVNGYTPTLTDKANCPDGIYNIVNVEPVSPAFVDLLYIIQLRK